MQNLKKRRLKRLLLRIFLSELVVEQVTEIFNKNIESWNVEKNVSEVTN